ncbi:low molecular weight protein tyrosine phosphatase family protein [Clostridium cellulovorans]|uniref:Protein-tyrosine phosphatase, low molecular weight n=1 Tax=Clostridium cellulovorans (strain ATCC 35296 / DSM 3052 / OCM 3 / 743B) TaxID=573061 RepID=D9SN60_CLOC7|nr:protein-tyrosine-phosphatase [Clostridium cellulovorans]ADL51926.1 Protein-tyrosine phosphatase, low molecular weight [Clostridium cellulovorans 743B]
MINIKLLFICSRNKWRSLTAEKIFNKLNGYSVRSAGTETNARIKITEGHIGWADMIFVMEKKHSQKIKNRFNHMLYAKRIICLDIPDDYGFMDEELIELLKARGSEHIEIDF